MEANKAPKVLREKGSGGDFCSVPRCNNSRLKCLAQGKKVRFYRFPSNKHQNRLWLQAIRRNEAEGTRWIPKKRPRICSEHFVNVLLSPLQHEAMNRDETGMKCCTTWVSWWFSSLVSFQHGTKSNNKEDLSYVPTIFAFSSEKVPKSTATAVSTPLPPPGHPSSVKQSTTPPVPPGFHDYLKTAQEPSHLEKIAEAEKLIPGVLASMRELERLREQKLDAESRTLSVRTIEKDPRVCMFWTGFPNHLMFMAVFNWLSYKASTMTYWMPPQMAEKTPRRIGGNVEWCLTLQEEFFLTMVRLKTGFVVRELAQRFCVRESSVISIFITWINLMYCELREWFQRPDPDKSQASDFPNARVIIDCAEIFCETPGHLTEKTRFHSDDKHYQTFKFLVAVSAHPAVIHVSNVFGGRACDVHDVLAASQVVGGKMMADRGFTGTYKMTPLGTELVTSVCKGTERCQRTEKEVTMSASCPKTRIHVERILQRIKTSHILDGESRSVSVKRLAEQIFTVCAYLTNFQSPKK